MIAHLTFRDDSDISEEMRNLIWALTMPDPDKRASLDAVKHHLAFFTGIFGKQTLKIS